MSCESSAVGADQDVDLAGGDPRLELCEILAGAQPRDALDGDRKALEAAAEGLEVLVGEDRRRGQHRDLVAGVDGAEGGAHRHLRLAEADVAARAGGPSASLLEIVEDGRDRLGLVRRLLEGKGGGELALEVAVAGEDRRARQLALGVEPQQLVRPCRAGCCWTLALVLFHDVPPSWSRRGAMPSMPLYFCTRSRRSIGTSRRWPPA